MAGSEERSGQDTAPVRVPPLPLELGAQLLRVEEGDVAAALGEAAVLVVPNIRVEVWIRRCVVLWPWICRRIARAVAGVGHDVADGGAEHCAVGRARMLGTGFVVAEECNVLCVPCYSPMPMKICPRIGGSLQAPKSLPPPHTPKRKRQTQRPML